MAGTGNGNGAELRSACLPATGKLAMLLLILLEGKQHMEFHDGSNISSYRTNLKVDGWFGDPIPFRERVSYVCDRNTNFQDEDMTSLELKCQDTEDRGYFDSPDNATDWPQCVRTVSCPAPVSPPQGVSVTRIPPEPSVNTFSVCGLQRDTVKMSCPSFLSLVIIRNVLT